MASAENATILTNEVVEAGTLFGVTDADGDAAARYEFWDDVAGGGYWRLDGMQRGAAQAIAVEAAGLADLEYVGGASGGTEQVWVRAHDGLEWGAWENWNMTSALHIPNAAPTVSASNATLLHGQSVVASTLFSVTDADQDAITQYQFWDSTAGGGHWAVDGAEQSVNVGITVAAEDLAGTQFEAAPTTASDLVWVRAHDGQEWGEWKSWYVDSWPHLTNAAPVVTAANKGLLRGDMLAASSLFSVGDTDGDTIAKYELWDDVNGGGHWSIDGVQQAAAQAIEVDAQNLVDAFYVGGAGCAPTMAWNGAHGRTG